MDFVASDRVSDLRLAVRLGFHVLSEPELGGVLLADGLLRYDPELSDTERGVRVLRALRAIRDEGRSVYFEGAAEKILLMTA